MVAPPIPPNLTIPVYVCDQRGADVKVFDLANNSFHRLSGAKRIIAAPTNICVDPYGYKFVLESMRGLIRVFDPNGEYLTTFQVNGAWPGGIAAVGDELFVTDVTGARILVLDRSTGKQLRSFGKNGQGPGEFLMPNAIAADAEAPEEAGRPGASLSEESEPPKWSANAGEAISNRESLERGFHQVAASDRWPGWPLLRSWGREE